MPDKTRIWTNALITAYVYALVRTTRLQNMSLLCQNIRSDPSSTACCTRHSIACRSFRQPRQRYFAVLLGTQARRTMIAFAALAVIRAQVDFDGNVQYS